MSCMIIRNIEDLPSSVIDERLASYNRDIDILNQLPNEGQSLKDIMVNIYKVSKMIWIALKNKNSNREIYRVYFCKYTELVTMSYDIWKDAVEKSLLPEEVYIKWCKESLETRESMKQLCSFGYGGPLQ